MKIGDRVRAWRPTMSFEINSIGTVTCIISLGTANEIGVRWDNDPNKDSLAYLESELYHA